MSCKERIAQFFDGDAYIVAGNGPKIFIVKFFDRREGVRQPEAPPPEDIVILPWRRDLASSPFDQAEHPFYNLVAALLILIGFTSVEFRLSMQSLGTGSPVNTEILERLNSFGPFCALGLQFAPGERDGEPRYILKPPLGKELFNRLDERLRCYRE